MKDQTDKMFGRSNNVTFTTRKTTTLGKRLHLHRHLPHCNSAGSAGNEIGNTITGAGVGCRSQTSKLCELRKSNSFSNSDNFTTRHGHGHAHGNVAIATQVISPSAIGQSSWARAATGFDGAGGGRGTRLITSGFGRLGRRALPDEDDDDDQNSLLIGRRRRWCTWSKLGCVGTTIGASIIAMTIIILAVGYMQSEKERVFSKPVRFVQRQREREGKTLIHQYRALLDEIEPWSSTSTVSPSLVPSTETIMGSKINDTDQNLNHETEAEFSVTTYRPTPPRVDNESVSAFTPLPTGSSSFSNSQDREAEVIKEISDLVNLNEISISDPTNTNTNTKEQIQSKQSQLNHNGINGLHQLHPHPQLPLQPYHEREHEQVISGEHGQSELFEFSDSPPSEVKVLPPKDFVFNPNPNSISIAEAVGPAIPAVHNGGSSGNNGASAPADIVQQLNNAHNGDNGLSFTIPIYSAGEGAGAADITRDMLDSFTSSTTTTRSTNTVNVNSTQSDELILVHHHAIDAIDATTIATAAAPATEPSSSSSSTSSSSIPGAIADYANPFNYEPSPVQNLHTKVEHQSTNTNDVPVVAKLQTDLFDEDEDEDRRGPSHGYENEVDLDLEGGNGNWHANVNARGPNPGNPGLGVSVRGNNVYVHGHGSRGSAGQGQGQRNLHGHGYGYYGDRERQRPSGPPPPPRVRVHDRMYTPKPGSVVIIEPVEYPSRAEEGRNQRPPPGAHNTHHDPRGHDPDHDEDDDERHEHHDEDEPPTKVYTHTPAPSPQPRPQPRPQHKPRPPQPPPPTSTPKPNSEFYPSQRPRTFPLKTTSTVSSFSKLYEFHDENGHGNANQGHEHGQGNGNANDGRANVNTKVEYIKIDSSAAKPFVPSRPMPSSTSPPHSHSHEEFRHPNHNHNHNHDYPHSHTHSQIETHAPAIPTTTTTTTPTPPVHQYMKHLTHFPLQNDHAYFSPVDHNHNHNHDEGGSVREIKNPLLSPEVNRFLSNLNSNANAQISANSILAPIGMTVSISPAPTHNHNHGHHHAHGHHGHSHVQPSSGGFGIATNSHLAELSNFDNFDFSQFLTKTPEPTAANNYGGATTPVTDATTDMHLTKRTFFGFESAPSTTSASTNPFAYLFTGNGNGNGNPALNVLGSPTSAGAGLSLHPFNQNTGHTNYMDSVSGSDKLPSGSIPLDLASSYIPVTFQSSVPIASATAYGAPAGTPSLSLINYNDPTLALSSYYPGLSTQTSSSGNGNGNGAGNAGGGNYNTITQGIHLLSLLSGTIPQHLLTDQQASGSSVNTVRARTDLSQAQSRSNDSPSSSLLASLVPDQLGSFSQNIVTKLNAIKNQVMKNAIAAKLANTNANLKSKSSTNTNTMDILGIRTSGPDAEEQHSHSTLVKKDGAKNYGGGEGELTLTSKTMGKAKVDLLNQGSLATATTDTKKKFVAGLKSGFYT